MIDDGYIKFRFNLISKQLSANNIKEINYYRKILFDKGFIGMNDGIGFGNISKRADDSSFIISGSKTGGLKELKAEHYSKVINWDFKNNFIEAIGQTAPSSESLTHAIFYELDKNINVVIHIHNSELWNKYLNTLPTSSPKAEFGSMEIVKEIKSLYNNSNLKEKGVLIMAGHKDGLFFFGDSFENAMARIKELRN